MSKSKHQTKKHQLAARAKERADPSSLSGACLPNPPERYCFFWVTEHPFSQWHKSPYTLDGFHYTCAEQGMMHSKALVFGDEAAATQIMETTSPRKIKALGRQVRGFSDKLWKQHRRDIVYQHNLAKFAQNKELCQVLLRTKSRTLVEASPYDQIWGIGLQERDAVRIPEHQWPGLNLLGKVLMQVRTTLLAEYPSQEMLDPKEREAEMKQATDLT